MTDLPLQTEYTFDPKSSAVLQGLPGVHKSHRKLRAVVDSKASGVFQTCEANRVSLRSGLSYDQFLSGMLFQDEQILCSGSLLFYREVVFQHVAEPNVMPALKDNMSRGRLFLTNHRIMFLSAEQAQGLSFAGADISTKHMPSKTYLLSGSCSDVLHYQCLPLGCVKSLEFNAWISASTTTNIVPKRPGCCLSLCGCCGMGMCLKSWFSQNFQTVNPNMRILTLGVTLPPWGHKCMVKIHVDESVALNLMKEFISDLQRYAPDLYTGAMTKRD